MAVIYLTSLISENHTKMLVQLQLGSYAPPPPNSVRHCYWSHESIRRESSGPGSVLHVNPRTQTTFKLFELEFDPLLELTALEPTTIYH